VVRFGWTAPRPSLHSRQVGGSTRHPRTGANLEVGRRLVNSLLERLRRRLHELGRPLRDSPSLEGGRRSSRADSDAAPERRTEIEPTGRRQGPDRTGTGEEARLPGQQPPPPASTRLKAAVFSKKRQPGPQRQAGTIWGPTSFLDVGTGATGDDKAERSPLVLFDPEPWAAGGGQSPNVMSGPMRPPPPTTHTVGTSADSAGQPWWTPEQAAPTLPGVVDSPATPMVGATPLDGATALGLDRETSRPIPEAFQLDLDFGRASPASVPWLRD
jgi:hypothetical protein